MREPTRPTLSGWCSPCCSPRAHATCQDRLDRQQLARCECEARGGHELVAINDPSPETTALIERLDRELTQKKATE